MEGKPIIQGDLYKRFSSSVRTIKIHLSNFKYNHKDDYDQQDVYIDRDILENKLQNWLTSPSKSGSYLVSGYRGMGKSSLVSHIVDKITRQNDNGVERIYRLSLLILFIALICLVCDHYILSMVFGMVFLFTALIVVVHKYLYIGAFENTVNQTPNSSYFSRIKLEKFLVSRDLRQKRYNRIKIKVNLGKEVMNERDVLCLIADNIRIRYEEYMRTGQNKPLWMYMWFILNVIATYTAYQYCVKPLSGIILGIENIESESWFLHFITWIIAILKEMQNETVLMLVCRIFCLSVCFTIIRHIFIRIMMLFDSSARCLQQLRDLSEHLSSAISEGEEHVPFMSGIVNISFFGHKRKESQIANVRDIETELIEIINTLNSTKCIKPLRVQFIIVLDELDKVDSNSDKNNNESLKVDETTSDLVPPDFMSVVNGFSSSATNNERRKTILQLLANMKLFLTSAGAKFIFISGRELYEAFLADLSDREYAISSIFSGVINVSSFLQPPREQSDISSMTEQYVSEILLPRNYLRRKSEENARQNKVLKREIPSLRWYTQYLTELAEKECEDKEKLSYRKTEIRHVVMFLHYFTVYLSHISNGSPKKIVLYFEKYVRRKEDCLSLTEWDDVLEYGTPQKYVLYFTPHSQHKIGFISHLAAPIMDVIINNVSNYDDKLLTSASFLLDHIFKFHGRGFSWRNIEQTPELLDVNKTAELRDFITSIIEFMQQLHIAPITVGLFQFKFRRRISEEISYISRISNEAAAIFNFTLNETHAIKQYNFKLLNYYMALSKNTSDTNTRQIYDEIIANAHLTIADLYFQEEDYSRAMQEYRSVLSHLDRIRKANNDKESTSSIVLRISCMLKLGLTCEYCKTYETAYVVYCSLVNEMISVREIAERDLGLDIIDKWTNDWRIKQPVIVDVGVRMKDDSSRKHSLKDIDTKIIDNYREQILRGLWDDGFNRNDTSSYYDSRSYYKPAEYSLDFDNLVSGFSKSLSPAKSQIITRLSMFEDVRLIYKAILAKLFILEKMNMNGITQSNIEIAEAEFKYLHRTINLKEKFFISADFFNQMGKILFYKNNISLLSYSDVNKQSENEIDNIEEEEEDRMKETIYRALYWYDIDILAYLDDFCFRECHRKSYNLSSQKDAVSIKEDIKRFIKIITIEDIMPNNDNYYKLKYLYLDTWIKEMTNWDIGCDKKDAMHKKWSKEIIDSYIQYIGDRYERRIHPYIIDNIGDCSRQRCSKTAKKCNLPCFACRYYMRSMRILIENMFVKYNDNYDSQRIYTPKYMAIFLLRHSFNKCLRYTRVNHLKLLAVNSMNMGDIMFSCMAERRMSPSVLTIVRDVLDDHTHWENENIGDRDSNKEQKMAILDEEFNIYTKVDRAILYYLAAFRFCKIAHQPKDASDCLFRILRILNEVVTVVNFNKKSGYEYNKDSEELLKCSNIIIGDVQTIDNHNTESRDLLTILFSRFAKLVNEQYGYSSVSEIHNHKWMFHMKANEDVDLQRLQTYSELKEPLWLIADTRVKFMNIMYHHYRHQSSHSEELKNIKRKRKEEIILAYRHFQPLGHINDTFYSQITSLYARFRLNKWILKDMFGMDPLVDRQNSHRYNKDFVNTFLKCLLSYLEMPLSKQSLCTEIFNIKDERKDKLRLVEFILEDSIVCLTEIIYILTPYNHISSFSNSFVASIYEQLWEWSKMYESLIMVYDYKQYKHKLDMDKIFKAWGGNTYKSLKQIAEECSPFIEDDDHVRQRYGSLSNRFFMRLRHQIDDKMLQHVMSNYAAEMALRYYGLAESSHSEGNAYKNQINRNYILNDDLDNDTWLLNTVLERFRLHSDYIQNHRRRLVRLYHDSRLNKYDSYIREKPREEEYSKLFDTIRFDDSLTTNTELQ